MCFDVERARNGTLTARIRVCGRVMIDGQSYAYDREVRIKLKKD